MDRVTFRTSARRSPGLWCSRRDHEVLCLRTKVNDEIRRQDRTVEVRLQLGPVGVQRVESTIQLWLRETEPADVELRIDDGINVVIRPEQRTDQGHRPCIG